MNLSPPRQRPGHTHHHFPFAETPEVNAHAYYIIKSRIRALIQQQRCQTAQRVDEKAGFYAAMHRRQRCRRFARRSRRGGVGAGVFVVLVIVRGGIVVVV